MPSREVSVNSWRVVCGLRRFLLFGDMPFRVWKGEAADPGQGVLRNQAGCCGCSQAHPGDQEAGEGGC